MKLVRISPTLDPTEYLAKLNQMKDRIPAGAYAFVAEPAHYNFYSRRCVKDLVPARVVLGDDGEIGMNIVFEGNEWKHDTGLTLGYRDVIHFSLSLDSENPLGSKRMGSVLLDEILPHDQGFSHEIALTGGTMFIVAAELSVVWGDKALLYGDV